MVTEALRRRAGRDQVLSDLDERKAGLGGQLRHGESVAEHARQAAAEEQADAEKREER